VASITVDLGPIAKRYAEKYGSAYIERPLRIGKLSIHLFRGRIVLDDFQIDGLHPGDRPFFTARQLSFAFDWRPAFSLTPDFVSPAVEMSDWAMLVEKWPNRHNFPRFTRERQTPDGPRRFTVTMRSFRAVRGQFAFEDHEAPWSVVCPNLELEIS